jgi:hypothetical protein
MGRKPNAVVENTPFDFAKSNQKFADVDRFCSFWAEYPDQDGLVCYLYRLSPAIDCRQTGNKYAYIERFQGAAVPSSEVLRKWGSGKYEFRLTDTKKPAQVNQVARCMFDLLDTDLPPIFNPSDLVLVGEAGKLNQPIVQRYLSQGWVIVEGQKNDAYIDTRSKEPIPFSSLLPPAAGSGTPAERELAETVRALATDKQAAELSALTSRDALVSQLLAVVLKNQAGAVDPMERAFQIAERLRPQPATDPVQVELLKVIAGLVKPAPESAAAANPLETTRATLAMMREMGWNSPGESSGGSGGFWTAVFGALPSILDTFRPALAALALRPAGAPAQVPSAVLPAGGGPSGPIPGVPGVMSPGESDDEMISFNELLELGQDALDAFGRGLTGFDFAHGMVCRRGGEKRYALLYKMGKQTLLGALEMAQNAPQLSAEQKALLLSRKGDIEAFIDSFMSYANTEGQQ